MKYTFIYFCAILVIISWFGCDQKLEPLPAQLVIPEITVKSRIEQGTELQQFSFLYAYQDGNFAGAFQIPAMIHSMSFGDLNMLLLPGILDNGIQQTPVIYPLFEPFKTDVSLIAGEITKTTPTFSYKESAKFRLIDDFESNTLFNEDLDGDSLTYVSIVPGLEKNGGLIQLDETHPIIEVSNKDGKRGFPIDGSPVYVELHYKTNIEFQMGLIGWSANVPKVTSYKIAIRPKEDWNKIYINFTPEIQNSQLEFYQLVLKAAHDKALTTSSIYLDNIKWLHL